MKLKFLTLTLCLAALLNKAQTTDASGKKQGYWKKKDETTKKLIYEGEFKDDKPVGRFKYYYANDSIQAIMNFKDGGKVAYAKLFHPTGKRMGEGKYIKEIKDSVWLFYDEAGILLSKDRYVTGKKDGVSYVYLPNGAVAKENTYKMDVLNGPYKEYFDGKKIKAEGNYVNGNLDGRFACYAPSGFDLVSGYYKNGEKTGPWIYKETTGKIKEKELYKNGKLTGKKETDEFFSKSKPAENKPGESQKTETKKPAQKKQKK
jgi:antitoxin component YwqK of YwqJK toxin-antitoxin module